MPLAWPHREASLLEPMPHPHGHGLHPLDLISCSAWGLRGQQCAACPQGSRVLLLLTRQVSGATSVVALVGSRPLVG